MIWTAEFTCPECSAPIDQLTRELRPHDTAGTMARSSAELRCSSCGSVFLLMAEVIRCR